MFPKSNKKARPAGGTKLPFCDMIRENRREAAEDENQRRHSSQSGRICRKRGGGSGRGAGPARQGIHRRRGGSTPRRLWRQRPGGPAGGYGGPPPPPGLCQPLFGGVVCAGGDLLCDGCAAGLQLQPGRHHGGHHPLHAAGRRQRPLCAGAAVQAGGRPAHRADGHHRSGLAERPVAGAALGRAGGGGPGPALGGGPGPGGSAADSGPGALRHPVGPHGEERHPGKNRPAPAQIREPPLGPIPQHRLYGVCRGGRLGGGDRPGRGAGHRLRRLFRRRPGSEKRL